MTTVDLRVRATGELGAGSGSELGRGARRALDFTIVNGTSVLDGTINLAVSAGGALGPGIPFRCAVALGAVAWQVTVMPPAVQVAELISGIASSKPASMWR